MKEAEKEQARTDAKAAKESEKEAGKVVKIEQKAEKDAAKSGFGSAAILSKTQSKFMVRPERGRGGVCGLRFTA